MMDTSGRLDIAALINTRKDMIHTVGPICHWGKLVFFTVNQMKNEKQPFFYHAFWDSTVFGSLAE